MARILAPELGANKQSRPERLAGRIAGVRRRSVPTLMLLLLVVAMLPAAVSTGARPPTECCPETPNPFGAEPQATPVRLSFTPKCPGVYWEVPDDARELATANDALSGLHSNEEDLTAVYCITCIWWVVKLIAKKEKEQEEPRYAWKVDCKVIEYQVAGHASGGVLRHAAIEYKHSGSYHEVPGAFCDYDGIKDSGCSPEGGDTKVDIPLKVFKSKTAGEPRPESVEVCWEPNLRVVNRMQEPYTPLGAIFPKRLPSSPCCSRVSAASPTTNPRPWTSTA